MTATRAATWGTTGPTAVAPAATVTTAEATSRPARPIEQDPPKGDGGTPEPIGEPADVAAVTDTLTTYLESIASGDGEGACGQLSASGVRTMLKKLAKVAPETRGSPCPQAILLYQGAYGESAVGPSFKSIEISGGSAHRGRPAERAGPPERDRRRLADRRIRPVVA